MKANRALKNETSDMSIREKVEAKYYESKVPYPSSEEKQIKCPKCNTPAKETQKHCTECGTLLEVEKQKAAYKAKYEAYKKSEREGLELFKKDALEEAGLTKHTKADKAYALAWEKGHSCGLLEVLYELEDLAELLISL